MFQLRLFFKKEIKCQHWIRTGSGSAILSGTQFHWAVGTPTWLKSWQWAHPSWSWYSDRRRSPAWRECRWDTCTTRTRAPAPRRTRRTGPRRPGERLAGCRWWEPGAVSAGGSAGRRCRAWGRRRAGSRWKSRRCGRSCQPRAAGPATAAGTGSATASLYAPGGRRKVVFLYQS